MFTVREKEYPNTPRDFTIEKFEALSMLAKKPVKNFEAGAIQPKETPYNSEVEKWLTILEFVGVERAVLEDMDLNELAATVKAFNAKDQEPYEVVRTIEVNGEILEAFKDGEEFKIKTRDWVLIETLVKKFPNNVMSNMAAVVFQTQEEREKAQSKALAAKTEAERKKALEQEVNRIKNKARKMSKHVTASVTVNYVAVIMESLMQRFGKSEIK